VYQVDYLNTDKEQIIEHDFHPFLQMFNNLMINAITALEQSERKIIRLEISQQENNIVVACMDTGCGIPDVDKPKVFTQYFSTKPGGTGVGLTHARYVVNNYNGSIEIAESNQAGFSTTFITIFPLK
jgi:sensor histidine kinase regulating citrate/malate metabolism